MVEYYGLKTSASSMTLRIIKTRTLPSKEKIELRRLNDPV